ncbi:hypothetical protein ES703_74984 [subsurface metagenome]
MSKSKNPYPESLIDEVSGIIVPDIRHKIWAGGYQAGKKDRQIIKSVIKIQNGMTMVFDKKGEQIPEYQGEYHEVKGSILKDAPVDAVFACGFTDAGEPHQVPREEW